MPNQLVDNNVIDKHGANNVVKLVLIKFVKKFPESYATET